MPTTSTGKVRRITDAHAQHGRLTLAQAIQVSSNIGFTKVVSLIDGIAAIAQAQIGDLVSQSTLLTTVSTVDPIKVYFPVSEREYLDYVREHPDAVKRGGKNHCRRLNSFWLTDLFTRTKESSRLPTVRWM